MLLKNVISQLKLLWKIYTYLFLNYQRCLVFILIKMHFQMKFKQALITHIYKKISLFHKTIYRPISLSPILSKVFEGCLYKLIHDHFNSI